MARVKSTSKRTASTGCASPRPPPATCTRRAGGWRAPGRCGGSAPGARGRARRRRPRPRPAPAPGRHPRGRRSSSVRRTPCPRRRPTGWRPGRSTGSRPRGRGGGAPVVLAGDERERRGHGQQLGPLDGEDAVQLGEAKVVADGQPDPPALDLAALRGVPRLLAVGLAVDDAAHLDVEHVDLPVHSRDLALGVEDDAGVRELLAPLAALSDRAAHERDPVRTGPTAHRLDRLAAFERLGDIEEDLVASQPVPLLREEDDVGAGRGRARDQRLHPLEVLGFRRRGVDLDAGGAQAVGHAAKDSLAPWLRALPRSSPGRTRSPSWAPRRGPSGRATR